MNQPNENYLIDENEIRTALKQWRLDGAAFSAGVRSRIDAASNGVSNLRRSESGVSRHQRQSEWFRVAASFAPIQLLGRNLETTVAPVSFAAISVGKKLFVVLAFPFLCFLMIGLTVIGMMRIRAIQRDQERGSVDVEQVRHATRKWWRSYGWIAAIVFMFVLIAPFLGWTLPLMIAMVGSGFAAVSLIKTLAKEKMVDRAAIGGSCVAGLALLGQLSATLATVNSTQLLDPYLVTGVLFAGSFMIGSLIRPLAKTKPDAEHRLNKPWFIAGVLSGCLVMALCSKSYWGGANSADVRQYVESFDGNGIGLWDDWADYAGWLNEAGVGFDQDTVLTRFQQDMDAHPTMRTWMLTAAARSGLIADSELLSYPDVQTERNRLTDAQRIDQPILNLKTEYFRIFALASSNDLAQTDRDVLANRLMVDWDQLASNDLDYRRLESALLISELIEKLDSETVRDRRTADVHRWLVECQVTQPRVFSNGGGFCSTMNIDDSDRQATVAAISLMEAYGIPSELDIAMLRSYLRPNVLRDLQSYNYVPRIVAKEKLERVPGLPSVTLADAMRSELPLWLAIMLVLLLAYATLSSPNRLPVSTRRG